MIARSPTSALGIALLITGVAACNSARDSVEPNALVTPPKVSEAKDQPSPFANITQKTKDGGGGKTKGDAERTNGGMTGCSHFRRTDATAQLRFTYENGDTGKLLMVESIGGGVGWLDFDGDQRWDLYFVQGGDPAYKNVEHQPVDKLFQRRPDGTYRDVTAAAGIYEPLYGQGVSIVDFDGDGFDDIYVANVGRNTLWKNQGDGTFLDVTEAAGVGDTRWSVSTAWGDFDGDGDLDLYVGNYCDYDPRKPLDCTKDGKAHICHPRDVPPVPDECYINQGDGTFTAEAKQRGLFGEGNRALGVVIADFDNDGDRDIYVANDTTANFLFLNDGRGHFVESGMLLGCAVDHNGSAQASMGVACGDYDGNGFLDVYCTHFQFESNTLYQNLGAAGFKDVTGIVGLHTPTLPMLGFGTVMADFNQDGRQELFVANGHIERSTVQGRIVFEMEPQLFAFDGRRFRDCSTQAGDYFRGKYLGRGVATCDWDDDGDLDVCVVHQNEPAALLENDSPRGHWLQVRLRSRGMNRRGIGARVVVETATTKYLQELCGGTSFASGHQPVLAFGLGSEADITRVEVRWPSGKTKVIEKPQSDRILFIDEEP